MKLYCYLVLLTIIVSGCCENEESVTEEQYEEEEEIRDGKQIGDAIEAQEWKVIDNRSWENLDEWVPNESSSSTSTETSEERPKRIRKRKRRPVVTTTENSDESLQRRKIKPETLDEFNNSWGEMENESPRKPYHRRRVSPIYVSDIENDNLDVNPLSAVLNVEEFPKEKIDEPVKPIRIYEKVRDPFTALLEVDAKARQKKKQQELEAKESEMTTVSDLKTLLKQSVGSISLSEILQQKNLSLGDLLQGKEQAISALTEKPDDMPDIKEYRNPVEDYPQVNQWKVIDEPLYLNRQKPKYTSVSDSVETIDIKNSSDIPKSKYTKPHRIFSSLKNYEVINEATTERRIFVPSHPKYYTSATYKPRINKTETTTSEKPLTTRPSITRKPFYENKYLDFRSKYVSMKPKLKGSLPITSAKLNNVNNKDENETTQIPPKAFTIDFEDIFGFSKTVNQTEVSNSINVKTEDGPMKMDFDLNSLMRNVEIRKITSSTSTTHRVPITEYAYKKIKPSSAREEISEILRDSKSRYNLTKILRTRNMTVEELVAQRERGSSQLHLADIFHNQTREPEPPIEPFVGQIRILNDRKPKTMLDNKVDSSIEANNKLKVTNFPSYKLELDKQANESEASPSEVLIWKSLYPTPNPKNYSKIEDIIDDVKRIEDIENSISDAVNNEFNVELDEDDFENKTFFKFPLGVKSAIIASAAIIGISCSVFLTIFIIFKWNQKQRQRLCYTDSFSCSRIKSPILETTPKRTIKTIMSETLGRKRKYSNVYQQSMSDYMWENDKKTPFQ